jgi:protoheme IX farnesyltransferase
MSKRLVADLVILAKVRVNALVVATTAGGYYLAATGPLDIWRLGFACAGTALVASGASAFNQVHERETDRLMARTRHRPVADGRMGAAEGHTIAVVLAVAGLGILGFGTNWMAALVALATLLSYALLYTPLKRHTSLATVVGAVPGALPPLIGWAAAGGALTSPAPWSLFVVMFVWQLPHFLAIAWMYRDDYARAGLPMLPVADTNGAVTGRQAALWAALLLPCSLMPFLLGVSNGTYAVGALTIGVLYLALAVAFAWRRSEQQARLLFYGSITYLPLLWVLLTVGRP